MEEYLTKDIISTGGGVFVFSEIEMVMINS